MPRSDPQRTFQFNMQPALQKYNISSICNNDLCRVSTGPVGWPLLPVTGCPNGRPGRRSASAVRATSGRRGNTNPTHIQFHPSKGAIETWQKRTGVAQPAIGLLYP